MRILITGGAGFIGGHTADALIRLGHEVVILDNLAEPCHPGGKASYLPEQAEFMRGDVRNKDDWEKVLPGVEAVYHFAAQQDYFNNFSDYFHINTVGTSLLYEVAVEKRLHLNKVIVASSQAVYGEGRYLARDGRAVYPNIRSRQQLEQGLWDHCEDGLPIEPQWTNEDVVNPNNHYALSKYTQELIALNLGRNYAIPSTCLRYSIVQGPRQSFTNAYSGVCRIFSLANQLCLPCPIFEDGLQVRDFVNIEDVVTANLLALEREETNFNVYNVGGNRKYTIIEFAALAAQVFCRPNRVQLNGEFRLNDTRHILSDTTKLQKLGWRPVKDAKFSLECYRDWLVGQNIPSDPVASARKSMLKLNLIGEQKKDAI